MYLSLLLYIKRLIDFSVPSKWSMICMKTATKLLTSVQLASWMKREQDKVFFGLMNILKSSLYIIFILQVEPTAEWSQGFHLFTADKLLTNCRYFLCEEIDKLELLANCWNCWQAGIASWNWQVSSKYKVTILNRLSLNLWCKQFVIFWTNLCRFSDLPVNCLVLVHSHLLYIYRHFPLNISFQTSCIV